MKVWKIILIVSVALVVVGLGLLVGAYAAGGSFEIKEVTAKTYYAEEDFQKIAINTSGQCVLIKKSDTGKCYVVCDESERLHFAAGIENGVLKVEEHDERRWYDHVGIFTRIMQVVVYLPEGAYEELRVTTSGGSISCLEKGISFASAYITASSGKIEWNMDVSDTMWVEKASGALEMENCSPNTLSVQSSSGSNRLTDCSPKTMSVKSSSGSTHLSGCSPDTLQIRSSSGSVTVTDSRGGSVVAECTSGSVKLTSVVMREKIEIKSASGSIKLEKCDAPAVNLSANSGSIRATLLTGKVFDAHSESGHVDCPSSDPNGGSCVVTTNSGSIDIEIAK